MVGPIIWVVLAASSSYTCIKRRELTPPALVFIGGTTMWWQEWYGDWGAYVLYNPHLALIPGYHWPLTSPNKPWAVIPAYGWFYALIYFPVLWVCRKIHARFFPTAKLWVIIVAISLPFFYIWDTLIEGGASILGIWSYVDFVGPAMQSSRGNFPLMYPVITFAAMMTITLLVIAATTPDGTPLVETWSRVDRLTGTQRNIGRILTLDRHDEPLLHDLHRAHRAHRAHPARRPAAERVGALKAKETGRRRTENPSTDVAASRSRAPSQQVVGLTAGNTLPRYI